jgi:hypothetical protein
LFLIPRRRRQKYAESKGDSYLPREQKCKIDALTRSIVATEREASAKLEIICSRAKMSGEAPKLNEKPRTSTNHPNDSCTCVGPPQQDSNPTKTKRRQTAEVAPKKAVEDKDQNPSEEKAPLTYQERPKPEPQAPTPKPKPPTPKPELKRLLKPIPKEQRNLEKESLTLEVSRSTEPS